jgi:hypothetical protein
MAQITYDPECEKLAAYFLSGEPAHGRKERIQDLAGVIQRAIEAWIEEKSLWHR